MLGHNSHQRMQHRNINAAAKFLSPFSPTFSFPAKEGSTLVISTPTTTAHTTTPTQPTTTAVIIPTADPRTSTSTTPKVISTSAPTSTSTSSVVATSSSTPTTTSTTSSTLVSTTASTSTTNVAIKATPTSSTSQYVYTLVSTDLKPSATGIVLSSAASATRTSTPAPNNNSVNTAGIIGGIAGGLAGLAILTFLIMFCVRRYRKHDEDEDMFNAESFKRQSALLLDDHPPLPPVSYNPRPLTVVDSSMPNASPALAAQRGYGFGGYGQPAFTGATPPVRSPPPVHGQPSFTSTEHMPPVRSPPPGQPPYAYVPYGQPPFESIYNQHSQLNRHPSNATHLSQESMMGGNYVDLNRSSVTPFQAAQYADIQRRLNGGNLNAVSEVNEKPLPNPYEASPFDDSAAETQSEHAPYHADHALKPAEPSSSAEPSDAEEVPTVNKRPDSVFTVYEAGDAYAGCE